MRNWLIYSDYDAVCHFALDKKQLSAILADVEGCPRYDSKRRIYVPET